MNDWKYRGYEVRRYANRAGTGWAFTARTTEGKLLYSGHNFEKAKAACIDHFATTQEKAA